MSLNKSEGTGTSVSGSGTLAPGEGKPVVASGVTPQQTWLPIIVIIVAMPLIAYGMTVHVLLPRIQKTIASTMASNQSRDPSNHVSDRTGTRTDASLNDKGDPIFAPLSKKILANIAEPGSTRFLQVGITVVLASESGKGKIEKRQDQLLDLANTALSAKTIADLTKPGSRNLIRNELISAFNNALGKNTVQDLLFTEFAIQ